MALTALQACAPGKSAPRASPGLTPFGLSGLPTAVFAGSRERCCLVPRGSAPALPPRQTRRSAPLHRTKPWRTGGEDVEAGLGRPG
jgi:hypothetical protein